MNNNQTKSSNTGNAKLRLFEHGIEHQISGSKWLSAIRLFLYGLTTMMILPFQLLALSTCLPLRISIPVLHHKLITKIIGLKIDRVGDISGDKKVLFVSNHLSYLDIIILGSLIPGRFIAKSEVANWPIFGFLSKITRTIFIRRDRKASHEQVRLIKEQLDRCEKLILFPEGTSSDGRWVLPFKSPLFDAAMLTNSIVQPITIRYTHLNGIPVGYSSRSLFGWYGDMDLRPHLWNALSLGIFTIEVVFHEPIRADQFSNRKKLAVYCQKTVAKGL
ncbi:1-acyl-sn-glycerol-3-phosphate acyltransferase [Alphaproteobacteria bacterium]|nr:1-acyl-sn-glycerol-3-phosphate acyltransferase [Alphaproteobacteria bacterium]